MREAVIVSAVRTAGGKAPKGTLRDIRPEFLGKLCMEEAIKRANINPSKIDDVIWGCSTPEQSLGMNLARITSIYAGIPKEVPAVTVNRFCSSGLQAIAFAAEGIISGRCEIVMAGGTEHMSLVSMGGLLRPNADILKDDELSKVYTTMGQTAENVAIRYCVSREEQDEFAYHSHKKASSAIKEGRFIEEIVPIPVEMSFLGDDNKKIERKTNFETDEGVRHDITMEGLSKLRPLFVAKDGSVTAGNSSQTTDGSSAVIIMSTDKAKELGLRPRLKFLGFSVAGCSPDEMGIGPVYAIPKVLKQTGLKLKDIGLIELNEAFASQSVYCIRELGINKDIVNVNGGAIALGHPLGATGAKLTTTLMYEMERRHVRYGMVTMCIGGGQGAAGIFELQ